MSIAISKHNTLSEKETGQISRIINICNRYDRTSYDFDSEDDYIKPGDFNYFILHDNGSPAAAVYLFVPTLNEAEVYCFTIPRSRRKGYMNRLFEEVRAEMNRRHIPSLLYVCDSRSEAGKSFVEKHNLKYETSEYSMIWKPLSLDSPRGDVSLRPVEPSDRDALVRINSEAFDDDPEDTARTIDLFFSSDKRDFHAVVHRGQVVGMIGRYLEEARDYIHGFAMDARYRGRGWGRQALLQMVELCRKSDSSRSIVLEVETTNGNALGLYQSCGFHETSRFDYYRESL